MTTKRTLKRIGKNLRAERSDAGLTLPELAAEAGMSKGNLLRIERGGDLNVSTLYRLCRALGTRPRFVLPDFRLSNQPPFPP